MSVSSFARRWVKYALAIAAVGAIAALALPRSPVAIFGTPAGDATDPTAVETTPSGDGATGPAGDGATGPVGDGATPSPTPTASSTTTITEGESPPTVVALVSGALGDGGWYVGDVSLAWSVTDDETPVTSTDGCEAVEVIEDTAGAMYACTAVSDGGKSTATTTIARDATDPTGVTVATDIHPAASGWFVGPFVATWSGTDATSGIASCSVAPRYSGPDTASGVLDGTCTDRAGNQSDPLTFRFSYDATAPEVTGTPDRAPDHNGWYNHALTITWSSSDPDAACDDATRYANGDSASAQVAGTCADPAGNVGRATFAFRYDETAPEITLTTPGDGASYILNQPVHAQFSCRDATSTIDTCAGTAADGSAIDTDDAGPHTFAVNATDQAGNDASVSRRYTVQYQPAGVDCGGVAGHTILEPIAKRSTAFKQGSTVPAKFRVCDWNGTPITTGGVVTSFRIVKVAGADADRAVASTSAHEDFRAGDAQWIFNIDTKPLAKTEYSFRISLDDGTSIDFGFLLR